MALRRTELAKLHLKVGWHIRGTSSYSSDFLRDIYAPKRIFSLKSGRVRPNIQRHAPRPNYPVDQKQWVSEDQRRVEDVKIIKCDMISAVIYIHVIGWHDHLEWFSATLESYILFASCVLETYVWWRYDRKINESRAKRRAERTLIIECYPQNHKYILCSGPQRLWRWLIRLGYLCFLEALENKGWVIIAFSVIHSAHHDSCSLFQWMKECNCGDCTIVDSYSVMRYAQIKITWR